MVIGAGVFGTLGKLFDFSVLTMLRTPLENRIYSERGRKKCQFEKGEPQKSESVPSASRQNNCSDAVQRHDSGPSRTKREFDASACNWQSSSPQAATRNTNRKCHWG